MNALDVEVRLTRGAFRLEAKFRAPGDGITVLFGPSGSGKSSLLSAIAGLVPCGGYARLGRDLLCDSAVDLDVPPHRRGIGMVFQDARLFPHLTARQNIAYAFQRAPKDRRRDIGEVAQFFDIAPLLDRPVGNLSGGEKSRVALARALVGTPDYLLLDEPFAALDGIRRRAFIQVLLDMHRSFGLPMLVVTHSIDDAAALASHLVALQAGRVVVSGAFDEATREPTFTALLDPRDEGTAVSGLLLDSGVEPGHKYLWLRADHVVLAAELPRALSARNILEGEIAVVRTEEGGGRLVELKTAVGPILSRVTQDAVKELGLAEGKRAWALVKAHALQH